MLAVIRTGTVGGDLIYFSLGEEGNDIVSEVCFLCLGVRGRTVRMQTIMCVK